MNIHYKVLFVKISTNLPDSVKNTLWGLKMRSLQENLRQI